MLERLMRKMGKPSAIRARGHETRWFRAIVLIGGAFAAWVLFYQWQTELLERRLRDDLTQAADDAVHEQIRSLQSLGDRGVAALVEAIGSERRVIAREAVRALDEHMDRLGELDSATATEGLSVLAQALANHARRFRPAAREAAQRLADQILDSSADWRSAEGTRLLEWCQAVFEAPDEARGRVADSHGHVAEASSSPLR